jgi:hypothetical protein
MIILKKRGTYLDDKSGGNGLKGTIIRFLSKDARNCDKGRRGEDAIVEVLQALNDSCYIINDITLPASRGNIDHVLLTPKGIFAIETKHWEGDIVCNGDEWHRRYHKGFFSTKNYDSGSPSRQVKMNAFNLSKLIETRLFHDTFRVWVDGLVVFTNPRVHLELYDPSITVLKSQELYNYLINLKQIARLSSNDIRSIANFVADL